MRSGDALLAPSITRRLVERFAPREVSWSAAGRANGDLSALTPRELEVLGRILAKLQLRDRVQAVVLAYETGLVSPGS